LVNPSALCRCRRIHYALKSGRVNPQQLLLAGDAVRAAQFPEVLREIRKLEEARRCAALHRSHAPLASLESYVGLVRRLISIEKQ